MRRAFFTALFERVPQTRDMFEELNAEWRRVDTVRRILDFLVNACTQPDFLRSHAFLERGDFSVFLS